MQFFSTYDPSDSTAVFVDMFRTFKVLHVKAPPGDRETWPAFYRNLAATVGAPLIYEEDPKTGKIYPGKWTEIKYVPENRTDTYKSSHKYQPLHTDYGYFTAEIFASFFFCSEQAPFGGATTFLDAGTLVELLSAVDPDLLAGIRETRIRFGRGGNPLAQNEDYILAKDETGWRLNWNYYRALQDTDHEPLVRRFHQFLEEYVEHSGELLPLKLAPGEGVFFHDRRVLHGRHSFVGDRQLNKGGICTEAVFAQLKVLF